MKSPVTASLILVLVCSGCLIHFGSLASAGLVGAGMAPDYAPLLYAKGSPEDGPAPQTPPPAKGEAKPNETEEDPGLYFLMAEEAEAQGRLDAMRRNYLKALSLDPTSAYLYTRIGLLMARIRKISDALIMSRLAELFDPDHADALSLQGRIFTVTGDRARAVEAYNRALELNPDEKDLYLLIGSLQASREDFEDAQKTFQRMIKQFPNDKEAYLYLGRIYVEKGDFDDAIKAFSELLSERSGVAGRAHVELGMIYSIRRQFDKAEEHFRAALNLDKLGLNPLSRTARLHLAQALANQKKYEEAYKVLEESSRLEPSDINIRIKMALILALQKQYDKATEVLSTLLKATPGSDEVRFNLGRVLREQGKLEQAEEEFVAIPVTAPTYLRSRIILSLMFLKEKRYPKAIKYVNEAVSADPDDADLYHLRGSILEELDRYHEALQSYYEALKITPDNYRLIYSVGNTYEKSGRRSRGMEQMEAILKKKPDDAGALNFVGYTLLVMGKDLERAEKLIRKASDLKPKDGYIMDSMGWLLYKKGESEEALKLLQAAEAKVKSDPIIVDHLGDVLMSLGRKEEALKAYRKSLERNPDNLLVQEKVRNLEKEPAAKEK